MEIVDVRYVGSNDQYQTYAPSDVSLINTALITANYGGQFDYIEYFIKDLSGTVLSSNYYATQYNIGSEVDPVTGTTTQLFLDPEKDASAVKYDTITFDDVLAKGLNVMDTTAFTLSQENKLPIIVFDMDTPGNFKKLMSGDQVGTIVKN